MDIRISVAEPNPPVGTVGSAQRTPIAFEGWLGLLGALRALIEGDDASTRDGEATARPADAWRGNE